MITTDIEAAAEFLKKGEVIGMPTETVYGLAGNAFDEVAIKKIFSIKNRPSFNPLIVHIKGAADVLSVAMEFPEKARKLAERFWPGPLTLLLKKRSNISDSLTGGLPTVAIRVPAHPMALALLNKTGFPIAAPSANPFKSISPTSAHHVAEYFKEELPLVLDGGICQNGVESTIVGFEENEVLIYRLGAITVEDIEKITGKARLITKNENAPVAPGMLSKHYSPKTPLILSQYIHEALSRHAGKRIGLLLFRQMIKDEKINNQEVLSPSGNLEEAAANLYAALHRLDRNELEIIIAERFPETGLGKTINDRLERAASIN